MRHRRISVPSFTDDRGTLCVLEFLDHICFVPRRIYWIYGVSESKTRAGHGHYELEQLFIAMAGNCDITVSDGVEQETLTLNSRNTALYIPKMYWRELRNFSNDCVVLVLASSAYNRDDYIDDYQEFCRISKST